MAEYSPMMQHYLKTKEEYKDCILFYRLGDFYEMFFDDALVVSKELELTLTGKDCGQAERAPMCGIPFHAAETYLNRLVANGHKVAICEQVEDPKQAKGIVKREVIRIVTPGTNLNTQALDETKNNYLMSIVYLGEKIGVSIADFSTGDYFVTELSSGSELIDEINKFVPSEIITNEYFSMSGIDLTAVNDKLGITMSTLDSWYFDEDTCIKKLLTHFKVGVLDGLGLKDYTSGTIAAGALLLYLYEMQKGSVDHITSIVPYTTGKYMLIDSSSRRNLELVETMREKQKKGSLLWVLDKTKTAMGARALRSMIEQPLINKEDILKRQAGIEECNNRAIDREEIREYLNPVYDLERIMTKISCKSANPRDLIAFRNSLEMLPHIKKLIGTMESDLFAECFANLDDLADIYSLISSAIVEEPPITIREAGIIKEGFSKEADELRRAKTEGKEWLAQLEAREATGIKNLKVKYNKVFGYYLEVTNSFKDLVPADWVRKQTLTNAERYTTDELKKLEDVILGAEDKLCSLEYDLFNEVRDSIAAEVRRIKSTARAIAEIDVYTALSVVAQQYNYVKPAINEKGIIDIKNGRHPVVEKMIRNDMFVANNTYLDNAKNRISIITGPNMAGKSTYMRQTALIVLMAQIGSFVPAQEANIGIVDRIFTRVGASDDLASGQSTFMVEMTEVANILRNATPKSLLILDEIGRGTSTFDGLSIAWAVVEYIANTKVLGAKTLFATHYHELTELEGTLDGVNNYCIAVKENGDDIVFLRKIIKGGADKSYGIQVAKLAGVPDTVIERAKELVADLSDADISLKARDIAQYSKKQEKLVDSYKKVDDLEVKQMSLFDTVNNDDIIEDIKALDISNMTPIDALNTLYKLQGRVKNRW